MRSPPKVFEPQHLVLPTKSARSQLQDSPLRLETLGLVVVAQQAFYRATSQRSNMEPDFIGNLSVVVDPAGSNVIPGSQSPAYVDVPVDSILFKHVQSVVDFGIRLLECPKGRQTLTDIGIEIITFRSQNNIKHIYTGDPQEMRHWVPLFLRTIQQDFPSVCLTNTIWGYAEVERLDWGTDMNLYNPKAAGRVLISKTVCSPIFVAAVIAS